MLFVMFTRRRLIPTLAAAVLATACAGGTTDTGAGGTASDSPATLVDRAFWSTAVTVDGEPFSLVEGTRIQLEFGADEIRADAGCNNLFASYSFDDDQLVVDDAGTTEMGCDPERHAQDDFVIGFLTSRPTAEVVDDTLTLSNPDGVTMILLDTVVADPDRELTGQAWEVTGFFDETAAWSTAIATPATLDFRNGTLDGTSGCGPIPFTPTIEVDGATIAVTGDVGDVEWCTGSDALTLEYAADLSAVLFGPGPFTFEIEGPNLRLAGPNGLGITARAIE